jgi:ABC-type sugar transport system permease subunit
VLFVVPLVLMVTGSLRDTDLPPPWGPELLPSPLAFENYGLAFDLVDMPRYVANSMIVAALAVPLTVLVASWAGFAISRLPRRAGVAIVALSLVAEELYELSAIEGSGPVNVFRRVTLPLMAPTLLLLLFRDTAYSFQASFVPALIVTEGGPPPFATTYVPLFVYRNAFEYLRYGYAAAATLVMFLVTAAIVYAQYRIVRRWRRSFAL